MITKRWVDHGATIKDPGMPLLTVMRTDKVCVILDVPERDVPWIRTQSSYLPASLGNRVELNIPALSESVPRRKFEGNVTVMASALVSGVMRTMRTEVHFDNEAGDLKPQMTGTASVVLAERSASTVPSSALVRNGTKVEIFHVADPSGDPPRGMVKRVEVKLGLDDGQRVEIFNEKLTGKELVIVKGNGVLRTGELAIAVPTVQGRGTLTRSAWRVCSQVPCERYTPSRNYSNSRIGVPSDSGNGRPSGDW